MFQAPKLTNAGKALYYDNIGGEGITFTTIKLGKGTLTQSITLLNDLVDTVVTITAALSKSNESTYVDISGAFSNAGLTEGFYWKEIGVFAADPDFPDDRTKDILFCYQNAYDTAEFIPAASVETVEKHITVPLIVGDADNVYCLLDSSLVFATIQEIENHNVDPSSHPDIRLAVATVSDALSAHEADNVPHISAAERSAWNAKPTTANVNTAIGTHNQAPDAHSDIRQAVNGKTSPSDVDTKISAHNSASDAHSALFNQKAAAADLTAHINNATAHITSAERAAWNGKVDKASGTLAFSLGRDKNGIYVEF